MVFTLEGNCRRAIALLEGLKLIAIVSSCDVDGRITEVNEKFCQITGYSKQELIWKNHRIINSGVLPKEFFENMWNTITAGKVWRGEICNRKKNGELYWVDSTIIPLMNDRGVIEGYTSVRFEITQRKKLEKNLFEQTQKLQLVLDSSNFGTWDWNPQTNEVYYDRMWCDQLGLKLENVAQDISTWLDRVHPEDRDSCFADINAHTSGLSPHYENVHRMQHANGQWVWVLDRGKIVSRDSQGNPTRFIGTHADITRQKAKEIEYKRNLETKSAILRSARFAIISTDVSGVINGFNAGAERILGYRSEEMIGLCSPLLFHSMEEMVSCAQALSNRLGYKVPPDFQLFSELSKLDDANDRQWTYVGKNGQRVQVRLSVTPLHDTDGSINGYLGIAKDLTEELATQRTIELQRANLVSSSRMAALGEMAAGIAHEVNNPLAIIAGKADVLLQVIAKQREVSPEKIKESLEKISVAAWRASKIISSLKSLARNAERDPKTVLNFEDVLSEALGLCSEKFKHNGIELRVVVSKGAAFEGRAVQIAQIITNILNNAFDAVLPQADKWVEIRVKKMVNKIKILFIDSGPGIPQDVQKKLMQPFFTTKEVGRGTGLGLSISRKIAEEHGGDLYFDSSNPNTCFVLELPAYKNNH
ncbi:MAG: hypothetical protein RJB66_177 [Pseudomonadota bacterium]|jgi:PAS domain S-box-containing protein